MIHDDPPSRCTFLSFSLDSRDYKRNAGFVHSAKVIIWINAEPIGSLLTIFVPGALFWFAPFQRKRTRQSPAFGWGFCLSVLRETPHPKLSQSHCYRSWHKRISCKRSIHGAAQTHDLVSATGIRQQLLGTSTCRTWQQPSIGRM